MTFLVGDDNSIRELVIYTLQSTGIPATGFACTKDFWDVIRSSTPSLVLLDIILPDEDGLMISKRLRTSSVTEKIPVVILTARGTEYDKVIDLDSDADDYIPRPFGMVELVSQMKAVLWRTEPEQKASLYQVDPIRVDVGKRVVTVDDNPVVLTFKEFELLCYLMENKNIMLTRDQLLSKIWDYDFDGKIRTVDVHIQTLRQKPGLDGSYIETIRDVGYKMKEI